METKTYKGPDFEVHWSPGTCIHSTLCWKNLRPVFDPARRPWIVLENGERESIKNQVLACPSGALQWVDKADGALPDLAAEDNLLYIQTAANGPLLVKGSFVLVHSDGKKEIKEKTTALCRCGHSGNKPFCDGSHQKAGFEG